jgi:hypothetical protein
VTRCVCEKVILTVAKAILKLLHYFTVEKVVQLFVLPSSKIFEKLPKVNSHSIGENSPNLVTLVAFTYVSLHQIGLAISATEMPYHTRVILVFFFVKCYHYIPWRDSTSRPIVRVTSVAGGDDTTRPRHKGKSQTNLTSLQYIRVKVCF